MIDVDEVEAGGFLAEPDLAGAGLADLDLFPLQDLGPSGLMDSDRVRHGGASMRPRAQKKSPAAAVPERGLRFDRDDQPAACAASAASSSSATMLVILIIGLTAGPAVSL